MVLSFVPSGAVYGLLGAVAWGFWALFTKFATRSGDPVAVVIISYFVAGIIAFGYLISSPASFSMQTTDFGWAIACGIATAVGSLFYYAGLETASTSVVSTLTAMYFVVAVILGIVILNETLTLQKGVGILFAVIAAYLLIG